MNEIVSLIGSVGFPIVACVYMATSMTKNMHNMSNIIEKNSQISQQILLKLDKISLDKLVNK